MKLLKKLQNPYALVAQGFVVGGLIFLAAHAESLLAAASAQDTAAPLLPSAERSRWPLARRCRRSIAENMVRFSFHGREFAALPQGALFWPRRRALFVADLHLEKASWFAKGGQMLPPYDTLATLADLAALVAATAAEEIWCLGDSFHDPEGCERLPARAREMLTALTASTRWTWVVGNHDPAFSDACGGRIVDEAEVDGVVLRHQADPDEPRPELSGHFHPKLRILRRGRLVSRRCFVTGEHKLILPAFGALTGGLDAQHPEILRAAGRDAEALVPLADRLLRFPLKEPALRSA